MHTHTGILGSFSLRSTYHDFAIFLDTEPPMRALLLNPQVPDTFWGYRHALRIIGRRAAFPPLGLLTVAAMLPKHWELRLIDLNVRRLRPRDLDWADSAWITGMAVQRDAAKKVIAQCRASGGGVRTVAGGPLFTCEPEAFPEVDHLILDEAEASLPAFLADLGAGTPKRIYRAAAKPDLSLTPVPRWDLINPRHYGTMSVQFSRGCPYDCDFCNVTSLLGHRPRTKQPAQVITELDAIAATGFRDAVFFVDDNLIGNPRAARKLLDVLKPWKQAHPRSRFFTEASINLADDAKLTAELVEAGFDTVFVGIETPDEVALTACHKRHNLHRDLVADVRKLHTAGLQVQGGFILGFDTDTPDAFARLREYVTNSGIMTAMVGLLQAPVGTRLYERMTREGRILGGFTGNNVADATNIQTILPLDTLQAGYRQVMHRLYEPRAFLRRLQTFLNDYPLPTKRPRVGVNAWWTFLKASLALGVLKPGRFRYWQLLAWTATHRRRHLPLAVRLWVEGHHFREICRRQLSIA